MVTSRMSRRAVAIALAGTLLAAPAAADENPGASPTFRNSCNPAVAALPAVVEGSPNVLPGARAEVQDGTRTGLYVWHEAKGWRVRLTHNIARTVAGTPQLIEVRGRITSSRPISNVRTVRLEDKQAGEWVSVRRPKRKVMDFRFVNGGYIDGINFAAGCAGKLTFTVWQVTKGADGAVTRTPLPVFVGAGGIRVEAGAPANPGLVTPPADATRVRILRAAVQPS